MDVPPPDNWSEWGPLGYFFVVGMGLIAWFLKLIIQRLLNHLDRIDAVLDKAAPALESFSVSLEAIVARQEETELAGENFTIALGYQLRAKTNVLRAQSRQMKLMAHLLSRQAEGMSPEFQHETNAVEEELLQAAKYVHKAEAILVRTGKRASHKDLDVSDSGIIK